MKYISAIFALIFAVTGAMAQPPDTAWTRIIPAPAPYTDGKPLSVASTPSEGCVLVGYVWYEYGWPPYFVSSGYIVILDSMGEQTAAFTTSTIAAGIPSSVDILDDGDLLLLFISGSGSNSIVRCHPDGIVVWQCPLTSGLSSQATVRTTSTVGGIVASTKWIAEYNSCAFMARINEYGDTLWTQCMDDSLSYRGGITVCETASGGYVLEAG